MIYCMNCSLWSSKLWIVLDATHTKVKIATLTCETHDMFGDTHIASAVSSHQPHSPPVGLLRTGALTPESNRVPEVVGACLSTTARSCDPTCPLLFTRHLCAASGWNGWLHLLARYVCLQNVIVQCLKMLQPVYPSSDI